MTLRAPIADEVAFAWWRAALKKYPEAVPDEPQCGFYKKKMVKGGLHFPARIWLFQEVGEDGDLLDTPILQCEVNGRFAEPDDAWSYLAANPISEAEFNYLVARGEWARVHAPDDPAAKPYEPINHLTTPTLF